jgi:branched-chain amino acid transport system substrate-binding protein
MRVPHTASGRTGRFGRGLAAATAVLALLAATACGDDDGGGEDADAAPSAGEAAELLGPEEAAAGEPVRIGMISDGATPSFDNTDELRAAEATAEFWNAHRGGVGGRPVEVVSCETGADPAGATDCGNRMVEEGVVAVALGQSAVAESVWEPLHASGVPIMLFLASGDALLTDDQSTFNIINPLSTFFGLPVSVAEDEGTDKVAFVVIDVPVALTQFENNGPEVMENAGLEYELITVPVGTADMTAQMQEVADSGAGVVHVLGNDAFCIAAFQGLAAVGYEGAISSVSQCITDATREAVPGEQLEGMYLTATVALGAEDDPTFQQYQAVMSTFGDEVQDVDNSITMAAYTAMGGLLTSLDGIAGDITPETVIETVEAMPEAELPGGGGVTYQCGGSALPDMPAVCTNQWLRTELDAEGQPSGYEAVDSSDLLP